MASVWMKDAPTREAMFVARAINVARTKVPPRPCQDGDVLEFKSVSFAKVSDDFDTQVRYSEMRLRGESHRMAEVLATRKFPGTRTDREFNAGRCNGNDFERMPQVGDHHRAVAEAAGVSVTGKTYLPSLASFPGDPTAWVSGRGDVLRVAKEKGFRVSGLVDYEPPGFADQRPRPDLEIDPAIVRDEVAEILAADPSLRREDVEERVTQLRTGRIDPHEPLVGDGNPDDHLVEWS